MAYQWRWMIHDPVEGSDERFPINPNEGSLPQFERNILQQTTSAPDGKVLLFEGRDAAQIFSFSGVILSESHYRWMVRWYQKRYQVKITDDLGNEFWLYLTKFAPQRKRRRSHKWAMDYSAEGIIVDWGDA